MSIKDNDNDCMKVFISMICNMIDASDIRWIPPPLNVTYWGLTPPFSGLTPAPPPPTGSGGSITENCFISYKGLQGRVLCCYTSFIKCNVLQITFKLALFWAKFISVVSWCKMHHSAGKKIYYKRFSFCEICKHFKIRKCSLFPAKKSTI